MKRIGIVGAGAIARVHANRWQQMPDVTLAGFYDIRPEAASEAVARFGGRAFGSLAELLDAVDVVDVCTPGHVHREPVVAALEAGVPTICEKPMARRLEDAEAMVEAAERTGTPLFVAHVVRFFPQFARAKAVLDSGQLGKPGVIRTVRGGSFPRPGGIFGSDYYRDFARSGGVILDVSIHDLDFVRWCCGEVERVFARGLTFADVPERDHALILLRFANGALGHVEGSWAYPPGRFRTRLEIAGTRGLLEWDSADPPPVEGAWLDPTNPEQVRPLQASPLAPEDDPYYAELHHMIEHLEQGIPLRVTPLDGFMAVKISLAAIESVRTGRPIPVGGA